LLDLDGLVGMQGWQWLFLAQGLPSVLAGLLVLAFLPERPAAVRWLNDEEKAWLTAELAREEAGHGPAAGHNVLTALRNPRVLALGIFGMLLMGAVTTLVLSAPLVLMAATGLSIHGAGTIVSIGGMLGVAVMLWAGPFADRRSSRFGDALVHCLIVTAALLALALAPSGAMAIAAYLVFAAVCFTIPMLTSSGWIEVLPARELAVGAAAINTLSQIGAFVTPFAWGALRDATGSFQAGLLMLAGLGAALSLWLYGFIRGYARASGRLAV
jgi:ACS family tartrate transporter-like MFS transporter